MGTCGVSQIPILKDDRLLIYISEATLLGKGQTGCGAPRLCRRLREQGHERLIHLYRIDQALR